MALSIPLLPLMEDRGMAKKKGKHFTVLILEAKYLPLGRLNSFIT